MVLGVEPAVGVLLAEAAIERGDDRAPRRAFDVGRLLPLAAGFSRAGYQSQPECRWVHPYQGRENAGVNGVGPYFGDVHHGAAVDERSGGPPYALAGQAGHEEAHWLRWWQQGRGWSDVTPR